MLGFQTRAGVSLVTALKVAMEDCDNERFRAVLKGMYGHLESGLPFAEAMEKYPRVFPRQMISVVRAGEMSSKLPEAFFSVREYLEWVEQLIADTRQASIYPAVVVVVVAAFVLLLFSFVVPKFAALLTSARVPLPLITQVVFGISDFAKTTWWAWFLGFIGAFFGVKIARRVSPAFALWIDNIKLKLPVFGELNLMLAISRFAHNLGLLYRSGIPIVKSLKLCEGVVGNAVVENAITETYKSLEAGEIVSEGMGRHKVFPSLLMRMVIVGENTGTLDSALQNVSDFYNDRIRRRIKAALTLLEPMVIVFLVFLVGCIALAIFLPILALMGAIK
jgi:type IV pilus assembly protein PilC